jgi:hypothetical protein
MTLFVIHNCSQEETIINPIRQNFMELEVRNNDWGESTASYK